MAGFAAEAEHLYIAVSIASTFPERRRLGHTWPEDEGVEIAVEGKRQDGTAVTYVLGGFADGTRQSLPVGGATEPEAAAFGQAAQFADKVGR